MIRVYRCRRAKTHSELACHPACRASGPVQQACQKVGACCDLSRDQSNRQLGGREHGMMLAQSFANRYEVHLETTMHRIGQKPVRTTLAAHPSTILPTLTITLRPPPIDLGSNTSLHAVLRYTAQHIITQQRSSHSDSQDRPIASSTTTHQARFDIFCCASKLYSFNAHLHPFHYVRNRVSHEHNGRHLLQQRVPA